MKIQKYKLITYIAIALIHTITYGEMNIKELTNPITHQGSIAFVLKTDQRYQNGLGQENYKQKLVSLPGVFEILFSRRNEVVNLQWVWDEGRHHGKGKLYDIVVDFTDLPGPEEYYFQFTWDADRGFSEAYFNGLPLRLPGLHFDAWWVETKPLVLEVHQDRLSVSDLTVSSTYKYPDLLAIEVPEKFRGKYHHLIGHRDVPVPLNIEEIRGALLYENSFSTAEEVSDWVAEGPQHLRFVDNQMLMSSRNFENHFVFWCPEEFPDSFIAEWDFLPLSKYGLAIAFFAAKGENGLDIFDPSLPARDGSFIHYIKRAIKSYHLSYWANVENFQMGRTDTNLRKNNQFFRVGGGPVAVHPNDQGWQKIRIVKYKNKIQLFCNGRICVDWTDDDSERYGEPLSGGKIGLRQMTPSVAMYKNFQVWGIKE